MRAGLYSANPGVEHIPVPLHGPPPHLELGCHHQIPAGMKAPQLHSSVDAALHVPAEPCPQAPCRAGSTSALPQESKEKLPSAHH